MTVTMVVVKYADIASLSDKRFILVYCAPWQGSQGHWELEAADCVVAIARKQRVMGVSSSPAPFLHPHNPGSQPGREWGHSQ